MSESEQWLFLFLTAKRFVTELFELNLNSIDKT